MAWVCSFNLPELKSFANVGMTVGWRAANMRDDVLLVQYMLRELFRNPTEHEPALVAPDEPVKVDGKFGHNTFMGIFMFQLNIAMQGGSIQRDNRIDPARMGGTSSLTQTTYTILWMNYFYKLARPAEFEELLTGKITGMPPELAASMQRYAELWHQRNPYANVVGR